MQSSEDDQRLARYRSIIGQAWGHGDGNTWPVKLNAAIHLFVKEFGEELLQDIAVLESRGWCVENIARLFHNPARAFRIIDSTVYSMRRNRYALSDQRRVVLKLLAMTKALKYGSEFNDDGRNTILEPSAVELVSRTRLSAPQSSTCESSVVHRFAGAMWAYTEAIFFRAHDVTKEIHGPYTCAGDTGQILVKDYYHLRPVELWPDVPLLPCTTIRLYKRYRGPIDMRVDALNHLYLSGASPVASMDACAVDVDGVAASPAVLEGYLGIVEDTIRAIVGRVNGMSWNSRVQKYAEIFWFRKKPISEACGRDWRVPSHVRAAIERGAPHERRTRQLSRDECERLAMLTI